MDWFDLLAVRGILKSLLQHDFCIYLKMTDDEMVGWHHQLSGHEFEQALGVGGGQGSLAFCSPWGGKESDTIEWLN